ncbi:hypothetical protein BG011_009759 [Mortierella polycephala]|uniref:DAGKc domain-containing protein n=1 Tax=Mortierella polycephala TaxID=41804 RepID=A0A9P6QJJ2_9FUNG|nr:hypothetical protein BG011_009759 [Mortierella polycephala]
MGIIPTSDKFPLLVVINPNSGQKLGLQIFETTIKPALDQAGKSFRLIESSSQGHAQSYFLDNIKPILTDLVQSLSVVDGATSSVTPPTSATLQIMVIGGDGTVHEIVNGILQSIKDSPFASDMFRPKVEFTIIPAGTGNAISTSLGIKDAQDALDRFLAGKTVPMRMMAVSTRSKKDFEDAVENQWKVLVYTVVVNSYGLHCATVFDAEEFRHLGNERFRQAAMKNVANLKQYEGRLDFYGPVQSYDRTSRMLTVVARLDNRSGSTLTLLGPFTYLLITKQASLEPGFTPTPLADSSDEWMDVLAVQNVGQSEIMQMFDATPNGQHIEQEKVEYFKAKTIELETPNQGRLCVDGEFLPIHGGSEGRIRFEIDSDPNTQIFSVFV